MHTREIHSLHLTVSYRTPLYRTKSINCPRHSFSDSNLYLPVHLQGAGLKTGDAHLAQGDGEVNLNAPEGAFKSMKLRLTVRKDRKGLVQEPFASTPTHWIAMGFHTDMIESNKMAVRNAIKFLNK
ncbi:MAG: acetamidase/formamidase family protein [Pseudomonadota bacterium]